MSKCFLIDGLNLIFRCFYAIPLLKSENFPVNAILGSVKTMLKILEVEKPDSMVFFLDKGRDQQRKALLPGYKANRLEMPDPVKLQIPVIKDFAYALGCTVIERSGVEADDLIASFAKKYQSQFDDIVIFTADKDLAQCVGNNIFQIVPFSEKEVVGNRLDREGVFEKFKVYPEQIVDYLSLIGDASDNIPGISGVGPKTAAKWLGEFHSIDGILSNIDQVKPDRFRESLLANRELLTINQKLICLHNDIDDIFLEKNIKLDPARLNQLVELFKLNSLKTLIPKEIDRQLDLFV